MSNSIKLSVLDQSPIAYGRNASQALQETIQLAELCDRLGYYRYWVAEHHASDALAGCSPEVLLARLGAETQNIRLGSGGVMLPHYSPFKVAENFKVLQTLYPNRIDLGVGRAPGTDPFTASALRYGSNRGPQYFRNMVMDLNALLHDVDPVTQGMEKARAFPRTDFPPELWMLGSSEDSAVLAGQLGLPYCFAYFINPNISSDIFSIYRHHFQASANLTEPHSCLAIFSVCAESEQQAQLLSRSRDLWFIRLLRGNPGPFPTVEEATNYPYSEGEKQLIGEHRGKLAVGDPMQVKQKLKTIAADFSAHELMVVTITHDFTARCRSYELLIEEWNS